MGQPETMASKLGNSWRETLSNHQVVCRLLRWTRRSYFMEKGVSSCKS